MSTTIQHQSQWFSIRADAQGNEFLVSTGDEVLVVPLTADGKVILTVEPSAAFGQPVLILPGGELKAGVAPAAMANQELQEEIGYAAGRLDFLGELRPWSKYLAVRSLVYLARDLRPSKLPGDETYEIGVERVALTRFETLIASGRLQDARVIAALALAQRFVTESSTPAFDKFAEYALFIEDTARFTDRRQTVTNVYVAVNTILLSAVALLITNETLNRWLLTLAALAVLVGGLAVCLFWRQLIDKYKKLVGLRIGELRAMEELPAMAGSQRMYHAEDRLYQRDEQGRYRATGFSDLERQLPQVFMYSTLSSHWGLSSV